MPKDACQCLHMPKTCIEISQNCRKVEALSGSVELEAAAAKGSSGATPGATVRCCTKRTTSIMDSCHVFTGESKFSKSTNHHKSSQTEQDIYDKRQDHTIQRNIFGVIA